MYVFQAIRTCGFWKEHNTLFNSKRLAKIDSFDTILYMFVAVLLVLLVFDRISLIKLDNRISYYRVSLINLKKKQEKKHKADNQGLRNFKLVRTRIKYNNYTKLKRKQNTYTT